MASDSYWIMCSYNNDCNTVLHLAWESKSEASIKSLLDIMCNSALMLTAFIHENEKGKIPLELAIENRHECSSNELVFKFFRVHPVSLPFVLILSLVVSFDLDLKLNNAFESIPRFLRAHRPPCILH